MTDELDSPETSTKPTRYGFWSLRSDEESVARGQLNFWAMLETVLAIVGFWWVALKYETFALLYTSLFVALLLLLRSDEAVRQGVIWWENGIFIPNFSNAFAKNKFERHVMFVCAGLGVLIGFGFSYVGHNVFLKEFSKLGCFGGLLYFLLYQ